MKITCTYTEAKVSRFEAFGNHQDTITTCLTNDITKENRHPHKKTLDGLRVYNSEGQWINPNVPAKWFDNCEVRYNFNNTIPTNECRDFAINTSNKGQKWVSFTVDQSTSSMGDPAVKHRFSGKVLVHGFEDETLAEILKTDGRFKEDFLKSYSIHAQDGTLKSKDYRQTKDITGEVFFLRTVKKSSKKSGKVAKDDSLKSPHPAKTPEKEVKSPNNSTHTPHKEKKTSKRVVKSPSSPRGTKNTDENKASTAMGLKTIMGGLSLNLNFSVLLKEPENRTDQENEELAEVYSRVEKFSCNADCRTSVNSMKRLSGHYAKSVCRILLPGSGTATGFYLGSVEQDNKNILLVMTNHHVVNSEYGIRAGWKEGKTTRVDFDYTDNDVNSRRCDVEHDKIYIEDKDLDFAIIGMCDTTEVHMSGRRKLGELVKSDYMLPDKPVLHLVGHPGKNFKIIDVLFVVTDPKSELIIMASNTLNKGKTGVKPKHLYFYHCKSFNGASGSPLFKEKQLIGMHCSGFYRVKKNKEKEKESYIEMGIPMILICQKMLKMIEEGNSGCLLRKEDFQSLFPNFQSNSQPK